MEVGQFGSRTLHQRGEIDASQPQYAELQNNLPSVGELLRKLLGQADGAAAQAPPHGPTPPQGPTTLGERGFNYERVVPGQRQVTHINPATGRPYRSYQEFAQAQMPEAYAHSQAGGGGAYQPPEQTASMDLGGLIRALSGRG